MSSLDESLLAVEEKKAKFEEEKGQITSKIGEAVMLFEKTVLPSGSGSSKPTNLPRTSSANIKRMGKGIGKCGRGGGTSRNSNNSNDLLMTLVSRLDEKVDNLNDKMNNLEAVGNTDELGRIMEAAKTALTLSLKNKGDIEANKEEIRVNKNDIESMKEKDNVRGKEMADIKVEIEKKNEEMKKDKEKRKYEDESIDDEIRKMKSAVSNLSEKNEEMIKEINELKEKAARNGNDTPVVSNPATVEPEPTKGDKDKTQGKMTYAMILQEQAKENDRTKESKRVTERPRFIEERTAAEIFDEAKHYVGLEGASANDVRKYLWQWESPENEPTSDKTSDDDLLFSEKFSDERLHAATGILVDRFGYYPSEIQISRAWFCRLRGRNVLYLSSDNKFFARSVYWKAAGARDRQYRAIPWIPTSANNRKMELERRLTKIRKTQENLRTQVRIGDDDFIVYGKYVKTNGPEKFEIIEKEKYDPNNDLPKIICKDFDKTNYQKEIFKTLERYEAASNKKENENENENGFSPVRNKRKERSPRSSDESKKTRKFSPGKAGKAIFRQIRRRGLDTSQSSENSSSESEDDANETAIVETNELGETKAVAESNMPGEAEVQQVLTHGEIAASQ